MNTFEKTQLPDLISATNYLQDLATAAAGSGLMGDRLLVQQSEPEPEP